MGGEQGEAATSQTGLSLGAESVSLVTGDVTLYSSVFIHAQVLI